MQYPPALFLHIQKTAGTSAIDIFRRHYGENMVSHGDFLSSTPEKLKNIAFVSGHMGYDFAKPLMHGRFTFVFLRNPVERILSLYAFSRKQQGDFPIYKIAKDYTIHDFLSLANENKYIKRNIWNNQAWQLAAGYCGSIDEDNEKMNRLSSADILELSKAHIAEFDYIGFAENFDHDIRDALNHLNINQPELIPYKNTSDKNGLELNDKDYDLLDELTSLDRELYTYAQKMKNEKIPS